MNGPIIEFAKQAILVLRNDRSAGIRLDKNEEPVKDPTDLVWDDVRHTTGDGPTKQELQRMIERTTFIIDQIKRALDYISAEMGILYDVSKSETDPRAQIIIASYGDTSTDVMINPIDIDGTLLGAQIEFGDLFLQKVKTESLQNFADRCLPTLVQSVVHAVKNNQEYNRYLRTQQGNSLQEAAPA